MGIQIWDDLYITNSHSFVRYSHNFNLQVPVTIFTTKPIKAWQSNRNLNKRCYTKKVLSSAKISSVLWKQWCCPTGTHRNAVPVLFDWPERRSGSYFIVVPVKRSGIYNTVVPVQRSGAYCVSGIAFRCDIPCVLLVEYEGIRRIPCGIR